VKGGGGGKRLVGDIGHHRTKKKRIPRETGGKGGGKKGCGKGLFPGQTFLCPRKGFGKQA